MNPLPQRKKTPEEIARLRETFGVPGNQSPPVAPTETEAVSPPAPAAEPIPPKLVRSLKKSEQAVVLGRPASTDTKLPAHRHNDQQLAEIRRRAALDAQFHPIPHKPLIAHPALYIPGYLLAIVGAICAYRELFWGIPLTCELAALIPSVFIFLNRPHSRHHAAFIAILAFFIIIFAALYYFPQLRHAT